MRQFQKMRGSLGNAQSIHEKMNNMPRVILAGLLERFTETAKGSTKYVQWFNAPVKTHLLNAFSCRPIITPAMENKLLAWQLALRLSLENWSADINATAMDLQMTAQR